MCLRQAFFNAIVGAFPWLNRPQWPLIRDHLAEFADHRRGEQVGMKKRLPSHNPVEFMLQRSTRRIEGVAFPAKRDTGANWKALAIFKMCPNALLPSSRPRW